MRKSKQQIKEAKEIKERHEQTKQALIKQSQRAIKLRTKDREFHGLERELIDYQNKLIVDYEKSKYIKHPRDVGTVREVLLREFLSKTGLLPQRYAVSNRSIRVASTAGHISNEIDIALFDPLDSISLMNQAGVYEVLPVESIFGVIQVKSKLTKEELRNALSNIASFKRLERLKEQNSSGNTFNNLDKNDTGFGLIFAFETDMDWLDIIEEIENFANSHDSKEWTNAVFILQDGYFMHGDDSVKPCITNTEIASITKQKTHGRPDNQGLCLWSFYEMLLFLLRGTTVSMPNPEAYFRLPLISGSNSYHFQLGYFAEFATCSKNPKHGDYQRKISPENLDKIMEWCKTVAQIDLIAEEEKIFPRPAFLPEPKRKQQSYVHLYNPDGLPIKELLFKDSTAYINYDLIIVGNAGICVPYFYSSRDGIISGCPKCRSDSEKSAKKLIKANPLPKPV